MIDIRTLFVNFKFLSETDFPHEKDYNKYGKLTRKFPLQFALQRL